MRVAIGSDHGGYQLKEEVKKHLEKKGYAPSPCAQGLGTYKDFGCNSEESCDYPDYAFPVAKAVAKGEYERGILICRSGIGMGIAANRIKGIRAAICGNPDIAKKSREHNDSNILILPADFINVKDAEKIMQVWFETEFLGGRHKRRIEKIDAEGKYE